MQKLKDDDRLGDMRLVKKVNTDSGFNYLWIGGVVMYNARSGENRASNSEL